MRIFALETNRDILKRRYMSADEQEMLLVRFHPFIFVMRCIRQTFLTLILIAIGWGTILAGLSASWVVLGLALIWLFLVVPRVIKAFIDWRFDFLLVTNDKVIIVDQSSIFHVEVRQMHLENFASVSASTQYWGLFPFGILCFDLKEGTGQKVCLKYIPRADEVASRISDCVECFQRAGRPSQAGTQMGMGAQPDAGAQQAMEAARQAAAETQQRLEEVQPTADSSQTGS